MKQSTWYILGGAVALIGGIVAIANPFAASIAAVGIAAWAFLISGGFQLFAAFDREGTGHRIALGLFGLVSVVLGIWLLFQPMAALLSLTLAVAILLLVSGGARIVSAFAASGSVRWALALSGAIAIGLGVLILSDYPQISAYVLGLLLGIELLFIGASLLLFGFTGRRALTRRPLV